MTIPYRSSDTNSTKHEREYVTKKTKGSDVRAHSVQVITSQNAKGDGSRTHQAVVFGRVKKTARKSTGGKVPRRPPASMTAIQNVNADDSVPHRSRGFGRVKKTARKSTCGTRPRPICIIPSPNKDAE